MRCSLPDAIDHSSNAAPPAGRAIAAAALDDARRRDLLGHQIHIALALLFLFLLPLATAPKDIAFGLLAAWSIIRLPHTWRCFDLVLKTPIAAVLLVWFLWQAASLAWSVDVAGGLKELGTLRMLAVPLLLWPLMQRPAWLIGAALAGVFAQNLVQGAQAFGIVEIGSEPDGRYSGAIHPIQTGAWCAAAMCWHLSALIHGRAWLRGLSLVGFGAAGLGLLASGSRGPWIAAAVAVPLTLLVIVIRRPAARKPAFVVAGVGLIIAALSWPLVHEQVTSRVNAAMHEAQAAQDRQKYWTSTGLRLAMSEWALDVFREAPIQGVGMGGFQEALRQQPSFQEVLSSRPDRERYLARDHPHSLYMFTLACTGVVGGLIVLALLLLTIRVCWIDPKDHVFSDGTLLVLISWMVGTQFDCYNLNGHLLGMFALIIALCLPGRPTNDLVEGRAAA